MKTNKTIRIATIVLALTVSSKILAFIKDVIFSAYFGTSIYADSYFASNIIPGLLNAPLSIGLLVFFIPIYNRIKSEKGSQEADRFSSNILTVYTLIAIILTIIVWIFAIPLTKLISPGFSEESLEITVKLLRISSLSFPVTMIAWIFINISNANQRHLIPQLLGVFNSLISIIAIVIFADIIGVYVVPVAGLMGWIFQIMLQKISIRGIFKYKYMFSFKEDSLKQILFLAIPVMIATGTQQIHLAVDNILSSNLATGSISTLNFAQKLLNLVNGTFVVALITIMYPIYSILFSKNDINELRNVFSKTLKILSIILIPITIISFLESENIIRIIYFRGAFLEESISRVAEVFVLYALGFIFLAFKEVYIRIFYIYGDSKTPTVVSIVGIVVNVVLNLILINILGLRGLALSTSISYGLSFVLLRILLSKKYINVKDEFDSRYYFNLFISSLVMISIWWISHNILGGLNNIVNFFIATCVSLAVYILMLILLKNEELSYMLKLVFKEKKN